MRNFVVNVNGTKYEVAVEEIDAKAAPAAAPAPAPAAAPAPTPAAAPAGGTKVEAPMPGNILSVNVKEGQTVKSGEILMILEAMKMENEILAPVGGTVKGIAVSKGSSVDTGALLCTIA